MRSLLILNFFVMSTFIAIDSEDACDRERQSLADLIANPKANVTGPFTVDELEQAHMIEVRKTKEKLAFGYLHEGWLKFKAAIEPGDTIYFMTYRDGTFYKDGHVLVHNGCVVRFLIETVS